MSEINVTIIKKKKVAGGHGHHGGAWKVAYADFVTAMMAFFLLMWLLNATTEKQRKGLADYFSPTIPLHQSSGGGSGPLAGSTVFAERDLAETGQTGSGSRTKTNVENGITEASADGGGASDKDGGAEENAQGQTDAAELEQSIIVRSEEADFELLEGMFLASTGESTEEDPLFQHIRTRVTDEGLVIELFDRQDAPLFDGNSDAPTMLLRALLQAIAGVADTVKNPIAVKGHAFVDVGEGSDALNWRLSTNRAIAVTEVMRGLGFDGQRIQRVTGLGSRKPVTDDGNDQRNNRLEIVLLR